MYTLIQATHNAVSYNPIDSHSFIQQFALLFPVFYQNMINEKGARQTHALIAKAYSESGIGTKVIENGKPKRVKSMNINGYPSYCQLWQK